MIAGFVAGDGEAEGPPALVLEHHDVGVIWNEPGEIGHQRIGVGAGRTGEVIAERGAIGFAGFEHHRRAADSARLDIDQRSDVGRQRIAIDERAGAVEAIFLPFVEQQDDRMRGRPRLEVGRDFEQGGDADPVIGRAWPGRSAVIMGVEQQRLARPVAADHGHDIVRSAAAHRARFGHCAAVLALAHLRVEIQSAQFRHQPPAHSVVGIAVDRVRALIAKDALQSADRPARVEGAARRWSWRNEQRTLHREHRHEQRDDGKDQA